MTVLEKYQRLEAEGIWRPDPSEQRRDVIAAIGDATLTLSSPTGQILTHWSLPAIRKIQTTESSALYAPGRDVPETLEISDQTMIEAIDKVLKAINRKTTGKGGVRWFAILAMVVAALALFTIWLPKAAARYVAAIAPAAARTQIGDSTFARIEKLTGARCSAPAGLAALKKLESRLFPDGQSKLAVLPSSLSQTAHLPGGWILVSHKIVEDYETPEVLAGFILAEDLRRQQSDPLVAYLQKAGFKASLGLLTKASVSPDAIRLAAERTLTDPPNAIDMNMLAKRAAAFGFYPLPFGAAFDFSGDTAQFLREASASQSTDLRPLLADGDWIALQRICEE